MNPLGYLRVSTSEQAESGAGLAAQERAILEACALRGWPEPDLITDAGVSGSLPWHQRPELRTGIESLDRGDRDALIVAKLDRLSRSTLDFLSLVERSRQKRWALVVCDFALDTSTPIGEMIATILAAFAQFERRLISQRTSAALRERQAAGVRIGRPPKPPTEMDRYIQRLRAENQWPLEAIVTYLRLNEYPTPSGAGTWSLSAVQRSLGRTARFDAEGGK